MVGAAAQALGAAAIPRPPTIALVAAISLLPFAFSACGGDGAEQTPSPTASPTARATRSSAAAPTLTPDLGAPQFDSARALEYARVLSVDIGVRAAGTEGERQAANFIRDVLSAYGYEASLQPFPIETFVDKTTLDLTSPQSRTIEAAALTRSVGGSVEGSLVDAGLGRPEDFPADAGGKIALIKRGVLFFSDKVSNAAAAGAVGVIIYNNEPGSFRGTLENMSEVPAVSISQEDGQAILDLLSSKSVTARIVVEIERISGESQNVVARPPQGECRLVVGGHYDSVPAGPGANDNASGTATVIEVARVLAADGTFDDVCFALFGAEEIGLVGSAYYVAALPPAETAEIEGMLNFDMLAVGDSWPLIGSPEVVAVAAEEARRLGLSYTAESALPENAGSDHTNFIQAGIPSMMFNCFCDEHYHTAEDRFEFVQQARLGEAGAIALGTIAELLASPAS